MKKQQFMLIRTFACMMWLLLGAEAVYGQEDRLARGFLEIRSIPARFPYPKNQSYGYFAIAKFRNGKFIEYCKLTSPVENLKLADRPIFETELGWAPKGGSVQFILVTPASTQGYGYDDFFKGIRLVRYLAMDRSPERKLGPFYVLGFGVGRGGKDIDPKDSENVAMFIQNEWEVIAFLMCWFETEKQVVDFSKKLPHLGVK